MPKHKWSAYSKSLLHLKVAKFFMDNLSSVDTPRGVAAWINEDIQEVRRALEELTEEGILKAHRTPSTIAYSFVDTSSVKHQVVTALKHFKE